MLFRSCAPECAVNREGHLAVMRYNTLMMARGVALPAIPVSKLPTVLTDPNVEITGLESDYPTFGSSAR